MQANTKRLTTSAAGRLAVALALGLGLAVATAGAARADNSRGEGTKALVDAVPRDGTGWNNGPATLVPRGGGKYRVEHGNAPAGDYGAGWPGVPVIVDNADGNPVVERRPSGR